MHSMHILTALIKTSCISPRRAPYMHMPAAAKSRVAVSHIGISLPAVLPLFSTFLSFWPCLLFPIRQSSRSHSRSFPHIIFYQSCILPARQAPQFTTPVLRPQGRSRSLPLLSCARKAGPADLSVCCRKMVRQREMQQGLKPLLH